MSDVVTSEAERKSINLHEDFANDNIIIISKHSAKDNGYTVIFCLNIPAMKVFNIKHIIIISRHEWVVP